MFETLFNSYSNGIKRNYYRNRHRFGSLLEWYRVMGVGNYIIVICSLLFQIHPK